MNIIIRKNKDSNSPIFDQFIPNDLQYDSLGCKLFIPQLSHVKLKRYGYDSYEISSGLYVLRFDLISLHNNDLYKLDRIRSFNKKDHYGNIIELGDGTGRTITKFNNTRNLGVWGNGDLLNPPLLESFIKSR